MIFEIILAVFALFIALYTIFIVLDRKKLEIIKMNTVTLFETYGKIKYENKRMLFITQNETYEVLYFGMSRNAELTINSRTMWEVINAGTSKVIDQTVFLASKYPKIVIVYPSTQVIKRYINENEMVFVKPQDQFYDLRLIRDFELDTILKEGVL
ncbi:MAG: hypothetical protein CVV62_01700 [Tenericutes bacterium HGW-Tenericutes-7]|nr:MAG: hypothetical protein CVV62_01700 [Tenericutes bacterium HGW-Tenericutes-7]